MSKEGRYITAKKYGTINDRIDTEYLSIDGIKYDINRYTVEPTTDEDMDRIARRKQRRQHILRHRHMSGIGTDYTIVEGYRGNSYLTTLNHIIPINKYYILKKWEPGKTRLFIKRIKITT